MTNRFASLETFKPDVLEETPAPPLEKIDAAAARHGFVSREPTMRRRAKRLEGQTDQLNIRANIEDINTFVDWCERNRFKSQREGFHELMKLIASK